MIVHIVLFIHIAAGCVALSLGAVAMATKKGAPLHRRMGKIYFYAMSIIAATAFILAPIFHNVFLFLIAILSFYAALSGYRVLTRKNPFENGAAELDWAASLAVLLAGIAMIGLGIARTSVVDSGFIPMLFVFGSIASLLGANDIRSYLRPPRLKGAWILAHIGNMMGSYIATMTAFSTTTMHFLPLTVRWLWPTAVLVPCIVYMTRKYGSKLTATWQPARP